MKANIESVILVLGVLFSSTACGGGKPLTPTAERSAARAQVGPELETGKLRRPSTPAMPERLLGAWRLGSDHCVAPSEDGDGFLVIHDRGWRGYEYVVEPVSIKQVGSADRWLVKGEETYLGSQRDPVSLEMAIVDGRLVIRDGRTAESYGRCDREE